MLLYKLQFRAANVIQSIIFGLLHGIMFFSLVGIVKAMIIILLTGIIAYAMGYVNEKKQMAQFCLVGLYMHYQTYSLQL